MADGAVDRRRLLGGAAAGAVAFTGAPATPASAAAAALPGPTPPPRPHLVEAQYLVDYLRVAESPAANNVYNDADQPDIVTWGAPGQVGAFRVQAQCASFLT